MKPIILVLMMCLAGGSATPALSAGPKADASNHSPVIDNILLEYTAIERGGSARVKCIAHDADGDRLTYKWEVDRGSISGKGASIVYTAPNNYVNVTLSVYVSDGRGGWAQKSAGLQVVCCGTSRQKSPEWEP